GASIKPGFPVNCGLARQVLPALRGFLRGLVLLPAKVALILSRVLCHLLLLIPHCPLRSSHEALNVPRLLCRICCGIEHGHAVCVCVCPAVADTSRGGG